MSALERVRDALPEEAKDIRLNLQSLLQGTTLTPDQRWGVALAAAISTKNAELMRAMREAAQSETTQAVVSDAIAAATLMAMNNVFYRFRHQIGKETYGERPARLRMNRLVNPGSSRVNFELMSLAVSAINGCETCVRAHEKVVLEGGLTEEHVLEAVRIAAVVQAASVGLAATMLQDPSAL